ncbi:MAG: hypothetical protein M5U12_05780 [Verrucomicrobia bacterium]|nr:hypothetical protein [Verrucomicrobiota bacterium]
MNLLYQNNLPAMGNDNRWLKLKLVGTVANRQGVGAKVRVQAIIRGREVWQVREVTSNSLAAGGASSSPASVWATPRKRRWSGSNGPRARCRN